MPPGPPPEGHNKCRRCRAFFKINTGAPSRTDPDVRLNSSCSVICRDKQNASNNKAAANGKKAEIVAKYMASPKGQATRTRVANERTERGRQCPKVKLKNQLRRAARHVWVGNSLLRTNTCAVLTKHTCFKRPSELLGVLRLRAAFTGFARGFGTVAHAVVPQEWYSFDHPPDVEACWHPRNLDIQAHGQNSRASWKLDPAPLAAYPDALFPARFPKSILLAAALHDGGVDLHSQMLREDKAAAARA